MPSILRRIGGAVAGAARVVSRVPGASVLARAVPFLGTVLAAKEVFDVGRGVFGRPRGMGAPPMDGMMGPMMIPPGQTGGFGLPRGPGGRLQAPWKDPNIIAALRPYAIDDAFLKATVRAPKGYVVVRDMEGRPFGVLREAAMKFKVWRPAAKPPISVKAYHQLLGIDSTMKKFREINKRMTRISNYGGRRGPKADKTIMMEKAGGTFVAVKKAA